MKPLSNFILIVMIVFSNKILSQDQAIVFGQQKAINSLTDDSGISSDQFEKYLEKRYKRPLYKLTQSEGAALITELQNRSVSKESVQNYLSTSNGKNANEDSPAQKKILIAASILEVGMAKRFHFKDGSISEGEITEVEGDLATLKTESGEFKIPKTEFLAETAEITNKKGERLVGHVLSETDEEFALRTKYGDALIHKKNIEKMSRYHGGILDKKTQMRKRFYTGEATLVSVFLDPTAAILSPNTFYLSGMSLGYGLTDKFMLTTKFASNFNGDLNLNPRLRFYHSKGANKERHMSVGLGFHRSYPLKSIIGKYSHAIQIKSFKDSTMNKTELAVDDVLKSGLDNPLYIEAYLVYTSNRINPTGRGKVGWTVGAKTSNALSDKDSYLKDGYNWEDGYNFPLRLWASLDYDLRKDLKFVAATWYDNGYKNMDAGIAFNDYFGQDGSAPLTIDSVKGKKSLIDFDFGILYAPTENFRIGVHFQQPFIDFYWEFFEF